MYFQKQKQISESLVPASPVKMGTLFYQICQSSQYSHDLFPEFFFQSPAVSRSFGSRSCSQTLFLGISPKKFSFRIYFQKLFPEFTCKKLFSEFNFRILFPRFRNLFSELIFRIISRITIRNYFQNVFSEPKANKRKLSSCESR